MSQKEVFRIMHNVKKTTRSPEAYATLVLVKRFMENTLMDDAVRERIKAKPDERQSLPV